MPSITDSDIAKIIRETLGTPKSSKGKVLSEAYVLQPKKYDLQTDVLSEKAVKANIEDFEDTVKKVNEVSAKLDSVDRDAVDAKDCEYRELKVAESYNLNSAFLTSLHLDNIADQASKITMDSLAYMRLSRDFGSFEDWQKDFIACALSARDGFAVTVFNGSLNRYMNVMIDECSSGMMANCFPVICLSVRERQYFRDYLNDRRSYVFAMMKELRWSLIEQRIKRADRVSKLLSSPLGD
jgi:Fe-Mn family superoxide dismutase